MLATGDEVVNGDILNTNAHYLAHKLRDQQIQPGLHVTVSDQQSEIEAAILFLLQSHRALIITGGLGPTSDDRTRFALSHALNLPLVFDEPSWQRIIERLQHIMKEIPETNRQQCLFPKDALIIPNANGTASACVVRYQEQLIVMLPGPPFECRPIFDQFVLPLLIEHGLQQPLYRKSWLLMGIGEGNLAKLLDPLFTEVNCAIGYRVDYPYIELKLQSQEQKILEEKIKEILPTITPYIVSERLQKASQQLQEWIATCAMSFSIRDHATYGPLQSILTSPQTFAKISFSANAKADCTIEIHGLDSYWKQDNKTDWLGITLTIKHHQSSKVITGKVPNRLIFTITYATEWICWEIFRYLTQKSV